MYRILTASRQSELPCKQEFQKCPFHIYVPNIINTAQPFCVANEMQLEKDFVKWSAPNKAESDRASSPLEHQTVPLVSRCRL